MAIVEAKAQQRRSAAVGSGVLDIRGVSKAFGTVRALDDVTLSVSEGEVLVVMGPSGSGKSSLVRCVHQMEPIDSGAIYLEGELLGYERRGEHLYPLKESAIAAQRQRVGMVFQQFNLFPHMTVLANVTEAPVRVLKRSRKDAEQEALHLLDRVGLRHKAHSYPRELSGGQKQRVAIARALAMHPKLLLFDEPTSALDPELVQEVLNVIADLARTGTTMVIVTHEVLFARQVATRVVFMEAGRIIASGDVAEMIDNPKSERMIAFLRSHHMSHLPGPDPSGDENSREH